MAASPALFQMLAEALGQPSKTFRAAQAGLQIPEAGLGGYVGGLEAGNQITALRNAPQMGMAERQMAILENFGKLSDSIGRNNALKFMGPTMQRFGIDPNAISKTSASSMPSATAPSSPSALTMDTSAPQIASASMMPDIGDSDLPNAPIIRRATDAAPSAPVAPASVPQGIDYAGQLQKLKQDYDAGDIGIKEYTRGLDYIRTGSRMAPAIDPVMTKEQALRTGSVPRGTRFVEPTQMTIGNKENQQQDRLESQAIARLSGIRGDSALTRLENQRDASIQAYNTIEQVKKEGRLPSQIEYYDLLGQMWKARTGSAPTDQAIRDLDAKTFQGNLGKAVQFFTGKPAGITTAAVLQNVQNFAASTGLQTDKLHDGYMQTHYIKPTGLDQDRWNAIKSSHRGLSFQEATGFSGSGANANAPTGAPQGTLHIRDSQGGEHYLPQAQLGAAKQRDPGLQVIQ